MNLLDAARSKANPVHLKTRSEVVEYFRETYPGRDKKGNEAWKPRAAEALAGPADKKSTAYKSAMRQFQFDKRTGQERYKSAKVAPQTKARYEAVGEKLPPDHYTPKGDSVTITIQARQKAGPRGGYREREFTATFKGPDAYKFVNNPTVRYILENQGNYPEDLIEMLAGEGEGDEGDYYLDVYSAA